MPDRALRAALVGTTSAALGLSLAACSPSAAPAGPESPAGGEETTVSQAYRDGTYEARGWYGGLPSHHDVTLTIEDGLVASVEITTPAEDETSLGYQQRFAAALPGAVVGRPVDELELDARAGSSGCSEGFMNALAQIRQDAERTGAGGS